MFNETPPSKFKLISKQNEDWETISKAELVQSLRESLDDSQQIETQIEIGTQIYTAALTNTERVLLHTLSKDMKPKLATMESNPIFKILDTMQLIVGESSWNKAVKKFKKENLELIDDPSDALWSINKSTLYSCFRSVGFDIAGNCCSSYDNECLELTTVIGSNLAGLFFSQNLATESGKDIRKNLRRQDLHASIKTFAKALSDTQVNYIRQDEDGDVKSYISNGRKVDRLFLSHFSPKSTTHLLFIYKKPVESATITCLDLKKVSLIIRDGKNVERVIRPMVGDQKHDLVSFGKLKKNGRKVLEVIGCVINKEEKWLKTPIHYLLPMIGKGSKLVNQNAIVLYGGFCRLKFDDLSGTVNLSLPIAEHKFFQSFKAGEGLGEKLKSIEQNGNYFQLLGKTLTDRILSYLSLSDLKKVASISGNPASFELLEPLYSTFAKSKIDFVPNLQFFGLESSKKQLVKARCNQFSHKLHRSNKFKDLERRRMYKDLKCVPFQFVQGRDPDSLRNNNSFGQLVYVWRSTGKTNIDREKVFKNWTAADPGIKTPKVIVNLGIKNSKIR
jgi:hypothetical protein